MKIGFVILFYYFHIIFITDKTPFLLTSVGLRYERAFRRLRLPHLLNHPIDLNLILEDNLMPRSWLNEPLLLQWNNMLKIDQSLDNGYEFCFYLFAVSF